MGLKRTTAMASEWSLCCHRETFKVRVSSSFSSMNQQQLDNDPLKQQTQLNNYTRNLTCVFLQPRTSVGLPRASTLVSMWASARVTLSLSLALICAVSGPKCATIRARSAALQSLRVSKLLRRSTFLEPRRSSRGGVGPK